MEEIQYYHLNFYDNTNIKELTLKDFNKNIKKDGCYSDKNLYKKNSLIIFYSNLCSSCSKTYNTWINIIDMYNKIFKIYAVNCNNLKDKNDYTIPLFKITKYPQYKLVKNNVVEDIEINTNKIEDIIYVIDNNK